MHIDFLINKHTDNTYLNLIFMRKRLWGGAGEVGAEATKLYCCFMAPMKLNSGMGGALKNDSIFKNLAGMERVGLGQLKQLISIYSSVFVCVCVCVDV